MGLADKLKAATKKAEGAAAEHKEQIQQAVQKAGDTADKRTGGKYHEQIQKAGDKAGAFVEGLDAPDGPQSAKASDSEDSTPAQQ